MISFLIFRDFKIILGQNPAVWIEEKYRWNIPVVLESAYESDAVLIPSERLYVHVHFQNSVTADEIDNPD